MEGRPKMRIGPHRGRAVASVGILAALTAVLVPAHAQIYNYNLQPNAASLSFVWTTGSPLPAAQSLIIRDTSPCPPPAGVPMCHWPTALTTDQRWLSVTSSSGTTALTTSVAVNPTGMAAGVYRGNVIATASQLTGSPVRIPVTLTIAAQKTQKYSYSLKPTAASLAFAWSAGSSLPAPQSLTIQDTSPCPPPAGVPTCHWPTKVTTDQRWLSVASSSGNTALTTRVAVNPTGMAAGVYRGNIIAAASQLTGSPVRIPVTLTVAAQKTQKYSYNLQATPASLSFLWTAGSATPAAQSLTIQDTSPCPPPAGVPACHWATTLSTDQRWLSVTSSSGTTALTTTVSVNPAGMAAGIYTGNIIATAPQLAGSPIRLPITLTVVKPAAAMLSVNPSSLNFGNVALGHSTVLSTTLKNNSSSNITVSNISLSGPGLTASGVSSGQILTANQTATLTVSFAPTASGTANGSVTITSTAANSPTTVLASGTGATATSHSVALAWAPSTSIVSGYKVYRGTVSGGPYAQLNPNLNVPTSFADTNVSSGMTYYYVVTSVDATGNESAYSNESLASVP